jgi:hypothetical protein
MKILFFMTLVFSTQAMAGNNVVCEAKGQGDHLKILFKERIYYNHDTIVDFKIKCRDLGGKENTGLCGHGQDAKFGFLNYYCVSPEKVETIQQARSRSDVFHTKGLAIDKVHSAFRVQPDCEKSAGVVNIAIVSNECRIE